VGALVLVDTRQLHLSFAAVNYFEQDSDVPFVVCVNLFDGVLTHDLDEGDGPSRCRTTSR
jgi:hypothetical protein